MYVPGVKVFWHCGLNTKWNGFFTEPDECPGEGEVEVSDEDFHEGSIWVTCDECGRDLEEPYHYDPEPPTPGTFNRYNQLHLNAAEDDS